MTKRMSDCIHDLVGVGEEVLLDKQGNVIARFYDGSMSVDAPTVGNTDPTLVLDM